MPRDNYLDNNGGGGYDRRGLGTGSDMGVRAGVPGEDGCGGRQKRCWKTANYEWMNIKRKPGNANKSKGNE